MNQNKLDWGITVKEVQKFDPIARYLPATEYRPRTMVVSHMSLSVACGDCGALQIDGANYATDTGLKNVIKYASLSGFSKIFATVVGMPGYISEAVEAFKKNRFICVHKGKSNRNPDKDDYVFVKIIRNPIKKGY